MSYYGAQVWKFQLANQRTLQELNKLSLRNGNKIITSPEKLIESLLDFYF